MYQLFASKDDLLAASLERRLPLYEEQFSSGLRDAVTPRERILSVFERLEKFSAQPEYAAAPSSRRWSNSRTPSTRRER